MDSFLLKRSKNKTFEEKIAKLSKKTQENIYSVKRSFDNFCKEKYDGRITEEIFEEFHQLKGDEQMIALRDCLQDWIDWLYKKGFQTPSVRQYISKIRRFFVHNGIRYRNEDFPEPLEFQLKVDEELHELQLEEIQKIFSVCNPKKIGFYLTLISTGARPGEILQLKKKDMETGGKRVKIRIDAVNVKTRAGRSGYLTKEAASYVVPKLQKLNDYDLVFTKNPNPNHALKNEAIQFNKATALAGFTDKYSSSKFRKITLYSFRSYFFGRAADTLREGFAHRMIGHKGYLPQYDRMSEAKKLEWFLKLEPELMIDKSKRLEMENQKQKQKLQSFETELKGVFSENLSELFSRPNLMRGIADNLEKKNGKEIKELLDVFLKKHDFKD